MTTRTIVTISFLLAVALSLSARLPAPAADDGGGRWPQWRGPNLDGTSPETGLPVRWGPDENVLWTLPLPATSGSSPIVWDDRVFLQVSYDPAKDDAIDLWCVDASDGKVRWKRKIADGNEPSRKHDLTSPSPVTDGEHVWALTGTGVLAAYTVGGEERWRRGLQEEYGAFGLQWGYASSPLLVDGTLYVQVLHGMKTDDPSYLLAIDAKSGKTRWRVERPTEARRESPDAYSTPIVYEHDGKRELVVSGGDAVTGHDPATGEERWRATVLNPEDNPMWRIVTTPLYTSGLVVVSGKKKPLVALRPGGSGDVTKTHVAWSHDRSTDVPTPVSDGERLYVVADNGVATSYDIATGKVVWGPERLDIGNHSASPVLADGRVYAISEQGETVVFAAAPEFKVLARNALDGFTLGTPAIAGGRIYVRTAKALYAVGTTGVEPPAVETQSNP
jgi:outer membrane protein assembly factor BamB